MAQSYAQAIQQPPYNWQRTLYKALLAAGCLLLIVIQLFLFAQWGRAPLRPVAMQLPTTVATSPTPIRATPTGARIAVQAGLPTPTPQVLATPALPQPAAIDNRKTVAPTTAPPLAQIADRLWVRLALTTTIATFSQNVSATLKTAGNAVAAARTATASAPTLSPTFSPTPSPTPTQSPTSLPTATLTLSPTATFPPTAPPPTLTPKPTTPRRPTATSFPTLTATVQAVQPKQPAFTNAAVKPLEPVAYDTLNDKRPFRWQANFVLPSGYAFELIFWQHGQDPLKQGKGYGGLTREEQANASYEHFRIRNAPEGEYHWGVLLVTQEPYRRIKYLGGDRIIYVKQR